MRRVQPPNAGRVCGADQRLLRQGAFFCGSVGVLLLALLWASPRGPGSTDSAWAPVRADELAGPVLARDGIVLPPIGHLDRGCVAFWDRIPTGELVAEAYEQDSIRECCRACRAAARCNAYIFCNQEDGCHAPPQQQVAGSITSLAFQGCLLLYQGLSDAKTGRPVLAIHASGFIGGAPITAATTPVEGYEARVGHGFFNRLNYLCNHPGRLAQSACILRGTPEELAPLCDADPKCRVMVHMQNGWDYLGMNFTEFKGGEGVDANATVASLNNNVASYYKLAPPPPSPPSAATSKALIAGVALGACLGAALMAAVAAVVVRWSQSTASPHAAAAAAVEPAAYAASFGIGAPAVEAGAPDFEGCHPYQGPNDSARTLQHKSPTSTVQHKSPPSSGGSRTAVWVAAQQFAAQDGAVHMAAHLAQQAQHHHAEQHGQEAPLSRDASESGRTKIPPWLGSHRLPNSNPASLQPGITSDRSPLSLKPGITPRSGEDVQSPFAAEAQSPFSQGNAPPTLERAVDFGVQPTATSSSEPIITGDASCIRDGTRSSSTAAVLQGGQLQPGGSKDNRAATRAGGQAPGAATAGSGSSAPAGGEVQLESEGQSSRAEVHGSSSSTGTSGVPPSSRTQLVREERSRARGNSAAGSESGSWVAAAEGGVRQPESGDSASKSWEEGVDALQAGGAAETWGTLGSLEPGNPYLPTTAEQLLSRLPEVHWQDWVVDAAELEFACGPDGHYVELGSGGFGTVYKVVLDGVQPYAGKVVEIGMVPEVQNTFLREASLLRRLRHRNIVGFRGVCISGGQGVLLMELMEGGDLFSKLQVVNRATQQRVFGWWARGKRVALDVARGIHYLHSLHLTHLDVKSSNVLLTRDLTAKLADVGFTRLMSHTHHSVRGSQTGTFDYMAPELLMGRPCNHSVDIYSFGVLLWEICSGEHPNRGRNISRGLRVPQDCPQEVADLCEQCMSQESDTRPTARQLVERITELVTPPGAVDRC